MFFVEPVTGAIVGKIWEERRLVAQFTRDFYELLKGGRLHIFVFGEGGAGKSTFGKILDGQEDVSQISGEYNLSSTTEQYGLKGKLFVRVHVPPGQQAYQARDWGPLFNALQGAERAIIVNVVCWGFQSVEKRDLESIPEFSNGVSQQSKEQFLSNRRSEEVRSLQLLVQPLQSYAHKISMLTLVTKQDLWWKDRQSVQQFYETGAYSTEIEKIRKVKGEANFVHEYRSVSFGQINFKTADSHVLFGTAEGYDNVVLNANFKNFLSLLRQIAK
jgi:hypothetical protein